MTISMPREVLATDLRTYGEEGLASRALIATDAEIQRIGDRGDELALTGMLIAKAVVLAAIEVFEGKSRPPRWSRRKLKGFLDANASKSKEARAEGAKPTAPRIKEVDEIIKEELAKLGMRRIESGIFTLDLGMDALGWLGLNRRAHRGQGSFEVYPNIGVVHEPVERLWAELTGKKYEAPATISTPLAYLMPEKTYRVWTFSYEIDNRAVVADMVNTIESHGIPYMKANATTEALIRNLSVVGLKDYVRYRLPLLYHLSGNDAMAQTLVQGYLDELRGRENPYSRQYREFAAKLLERIGDSQSLSR